MFFWHICRVCLMLLSLSGLNFFFFFFNDTATTEIYTLSLHDALPICGADHSHGAAAGLHLHAPCEDSGQPAVAGRHRLRSEEHTSELQSRLHLVCRLLLEKKKQTTAAVRATPHCDHSCLDY